MSKIQVESIEATKTKEVKMKRRLLLPVSLGLVMVLAIMGLCGCGNGLSATSEPENIYFPQLKPVNGERVFMEALLIGELVVVNGCIRMNSREGSTSYLVVWPPDFTLGIENDSIYIRNGASEVVARVGEEIYMSGGEVPAKTAWLSQQLQQKLPDACPGPYWVVGEQVRLFKNAK